MPLAQSLTFQLTILTTLLILLYLPAATLPATPTPTTTKINTVEEANRTIWLLFSNDSAARTTRLESGFWPDPLARSFGIFPSFSATTKAWSLLATHDIHVKPSNKSNNTATATAVLHVHSEDMLLRSTDCPELTSLKETQHHDGLIYLSLCVLRRCTMTASPSLDNTTVQPSQREALWSLYCNMLPSEIVSPVVTLQLSDATLSPYTRQQLIKRKKQFSSIQQVATEAFAIWHDQERTVKQSYQYQYNHYQARNRHQGVESTTRMNYLLKWSQSAVISRAWKTERFGCAAIPVLDFANHQRGAPKIVLVQYGGTDTEKGAVAWGYATSQDMSKGDEYFVSYDDVDDCDVDLWLDYGFVDQGDRRPCVEVTYASGGGGGGGGGGGDVRGTTKTVLLKNEKDVALVTAKEYLEFSKQVDVLLEKGKIAWNALLALGNMDDPKVVLLKSELELLESVAGRVVVEL